MAAYLVFFFHFNPFVWADHPAGSLVAEVLGAFVAQGNVGVTIFFVLSGFLIAMRYVDRIEPSWAWAKQYLLNRFARIYPLYFLLSAVVFVAMAGGWEAWNTWGRQVGLGDKLVALFANITLTRAFLHNFYRVVLPTASVGLPPRHW